MLSRPCRTGPEPAASDRARCMREEQTPANQAPLRRHHRRTQRSQLRAPLAERSEVEASAWSSNWSKKSSSSYRPAKNAFWPLATGQYGPSPAAQ